MAKHPTNDPEIEGLNQAAPALLHSITKFSIPMLSIKNSIVTLCITTQDISIECYNAESCIFHCYAEHHYAEHHYAEHHYAEHHYAEHHYAEHHYDDSSNAECRGAAPACSRRNIYI